MILDGVEYPRLRCRISKNGSRWFYYDQGGIPRRWLPLGRHEARALAKYRALAAEAKVVPGTIDQMLAEALEDLRGKVKDATLANYRGYRKHLVTVFADPVTGISHPPEKLTQADVLKYLNRCPRMSFRGEIAFLSLGYALWMDQGRLIFNPCFGVRCRRKGSKRTRLLTWAEIDRVLARADERLAVAIEIAIALGLRISDCCALRWRDVDEYLDTQKTGRRLAWERTDGLDAILARAKALQARVASLYVLCDRRGRPWKDDTLRDHWIAACKAAGVTDAHFHDLRAAAATEVEKRYGKEAARDFLGHKSVTTTETYLRDKRVNVVRPLARRSTSGGGAP